MIMIMENKWIKTSVQKPPVNVPVLCRQVYKPQYEPIRKRQARYHYGVHFIMDDGDWDVEEKLYTIVEWQYIIYNGKTVGEDDSIF